MSQSPLIPCRATPSRVCRPHNNPTTTVLCVPGQPAETSSLGRRWVASISVSRGCWRAMAVIMAAAGLGAAAGAGPVVAGLGAGAGPADRPAPPRNATATAGFTPLYCAGLHGIEDDDSPSGHQLLFVNLSPADCTATTLGLLATWLGGSITAGDLRCQVGVASPLSHPPPSPATHTRPQPRHLFPLRHEPRHLFSLRHDVSSSPHPYTRAGWFPSLTPCHHHRCCPHSHPATTHPATALAGARIVCCRE